MQIDENGRLRALTERWPTDTCLSRPPQRIITQSTPLRSTRDAILPLENKAFPSELRGQTSIIKTIDDP